MDKDSRRIGDVELAVDRVETGTQRRPVIQERLLQPGLEDAAAVNRRLQVVDAHEAADLVQVESAAAVADQREIRRTALPADQLLAIELDGEVEVAHVGPAALQPASVVAQVVGGVRQVHLDTGVEEALTGAAPVAAERGFRPGGRLGGDASGLCRIVGPDGTGKPRRQQQGEQHGSLLPSRFIRASQHFLASLFVVIMTVLAGRCLLAQPVQGPQPPWGRA
jgi:hypothetical protein